MAVRFHTGTYLTERHFAIAIGIAIGLHVMAMIIWSLSPREKVVDIPVRILNIKLGDEELPADLTQPGGVAISQSLETALNKQFAPAPVAPQAPAPVTVKAMDTALKPPPNPTLPPAAQAISHVAQQFVRQQPLPVAPTGGDVRGNSTDANAETDAQVELNYGKQLSLYLERYKIYPAIPKLPGAESVKRQTIILIRLDRRGNVKYFDIYQSSGNATIDQATRDMVRNANPFPAAPARFKPGKELLEFKIPISLTF